MTDSDLTAIQDACRRLGVHSVARTLQTRPETLATIVFGTAHPKTLHRVAKSLPALRAALEASA